MTLPLILACALLQFQAPKSWYGPGEVTFNIQFAGNPYDPDVNDVKVRFVNDNGLTQERLAFFDHGAWKSILVAPLPGRYKAVLIHNGKASKEEPVPSVLLISQRLPHGFIGRDPVNPNRFRYDDGTYLFPIGFNLGWQNKDLLPMAEQIRKMGQAGITWTRIWADPWDGKNPWWPQNDPYAIKGQLWPKALDRWQVLADACSDAAVNFQFVLFHHGLFSSTTNPDWPESPWNAAKGGFLKDAASFFTDAEAKRRTKMWLRYAVARWSSNPNLFAWELFNEVQWTDAAKSGRWQEIAEWHREMADYIRSLDPYGHLVSTSSQLSEAALWTAMDFYQPHEYNDDLPKALISAEFPTDKPLFVGEFGPGHDLGAKERLFVRNVIWESIRLNQAGAAMYWYWDRVERDNLYPEFKAWAEAIDLGNLGQHAMARQLPINSTVGQADGLREIGWLIVRLKNSDGKSPRLSWSGITDGTWDITSINLDTAEVTHDSAPAKGLTLQMPRVHGADIVLLLHVLV